MEQVSAYLKMSRYKIKLPNLSKAWVGGLAVFFCMSGSLAYGQSDSLITNSGAVMVGKVSGHRSFKIDGKKRPLDPNLYKAYKNDVTWYKSVRLSPGVDPVWMQWLEKGPIDLYQYIAYGPATRVSPRNLPTSSVVWLASKNGGPLLNVNGVMASEAGAKANLQKLLLDQQDLAGELDNVPFTTRAVRGLIAAYNRRADTAR